MNQTTCSAYDHYLQITGVYDRSVVKDCDYAIKQGEQFPSSVVAPITEFQQLTRTVGIGSVRNLLNVLLYERNNFHDYWDLVIYYESMGRGNYTLSTVVDMFNYLGNGGRKNNALTFIQEYKDRMHQLVIRGISPPIVSDNTVEAFRTLAAHLRITAIYLDNLLSQLDGHKYGYYTKTCSIVVERVTEDYMTLGFFQTTPLVSTECNLGTILPIVTSGNEAFVAQAVRAAKVQSPMQPMSYTQQARVSAVNEFDEYLATRVSEKHAESMYNNIIRKIKAR